MVARFEDPTMRTLWIALLGLVIASDAHARKPKPAPPADETAPTEQPTEAVPEEAAPNATDRPPRVGEAKPTEPGTGCMCPCECVVEEPPLPEVDEADAGTEATPKKNFRWTPYASPGASPEIGALIAAGALFSWSFDPKDPKLPRSSVGSAISFSTTGAILVSVFPAFYLKSDKIRINGNIYFKNMDDHYWGVGYTEAAETPQGPDTTAYHRMWWQFNPKVVVQVVPNLFVGGAIDLNQTIATDMNPKMTDDPYILDDGNNNYNGGIGAIVQYDTRDFPQNAFKGVQLEARVMGYGPWLGGQNMYATVNLDYRHYISVGKRPGNTVSWNFHSNIAFGNTPWSDLPSVGSAYDLRGYYVGRFRDTQATYALLEYRYHFNTKKPDRQFSRSGVVVWAGLGFVGTNFLEAPLLPNVGVGYRFEVQPRMNLRVDFGFGAFDSFGFYISFLEAY